MTKPNSLEATKQKIQKFHWPAWFPYPSSWFRAAILIPLAFPGAGLIFFGFTGVIVSAIANSPLLLIFSILFGLLIPTIFLSFIYHIFWFIWKKNESNKRLCLPKWIPHSSSLWEGFYATVVIGLSFILILTIFSELAFVDCKSLYQTGDVISGCAGRMTGRAAKVVFSSIENNDFVNRPWFIIWTIITVYLYQGEYIFRKKLIPKLKLMLQKYQGKHKIYISNATDLELDQLRADMGLTQIKKGKSQLTELVAVSEQNSRNYLKIKLNKKLLLILVTPLVAVGIYLFSQLLNIQKNIPLAVISQPQSAPSTLTQTDNFREAVNQAIIAANLTQSAKSKTEWNNIVNGWKRAIELMKNVPASSSNYALAQQKILEYQRNLSYAEKNALVWK
ncbi:hypothetical protein [Cylindrospermum sp. FACHB-282]|uniref:hypothetical protein n=1 Tax=Cylindrospermum sp. FACHB-282 TaxID=2692794 RepID=UPI001685604C|nr:hypothetical protein [Cylindrospermum sp. FACHB-282]MBD2387569.1 hypothetical protein [Cylindrospermum sp. FACHB-282]